MMGREAGEEARPYAGRPAEPGIWCSRGPDPPRDPRAAGGGRPTGRGDRVSLPDVPAGDLAAPQGARERGPHLAGPTGDREAEPPRGRAASGSNRMARPLPG